MAAVETILVARVLAGHGGEVIFNFIVSALIIFEMSGAFLSEKTLLRWKSWIAGEREALTARALLPGDLSFARLFGLRVTELEASDREEVLVNLVTFFGEAQTMDDTWSILQAVREREQLSSTALGGGVALPHCRSELVDGVTATCGLLRRPVEWGAPDGRPVDLVFLVISPARNPEQHLQAVRYIAVALRRPGFREGLRRALESRQVEKYLEKVGQEAIPKESGHDC
jgi:PTS system nitrogen regulatory IIA component